MKNGVEEAYEYCRVLTRREARNFYYGFMLLPPAQRRAIHAAYAFARECDDIVDDMAADEAEGLLETHRLRLDACLSGEPDGPVFEALADAVARFQIPRAYFQELIDGVSMDLTRSRYADFNELKAYCHRVASTVGLISIEVFGYRGGEASRRRAADLGVALQLTNILRDVREDGERGRIYMPLDEIKSFGYSEGELLAGMVTPAFRRLVAFQATRARVYFSRGRMLLPRLPRRARACVGVMTGIYQSILSGIERDPPVVFRRRLSVGTPRKLALAGREVVRSLAG